MMWCLLQDVSFLGGCFGEGAGVAPSEVWLFNGTGPTDSAPTLNRLRDSAGLVTLSKGLLSTSLPPVSITAVVF